MDWEIVTASDIVSSSATATSFGLDGLTYGSQPGDLPGPYLVLPVTNASGQTSISYSVSNLAAGQRVMFKVLMIEPRPSGYLPASPQLRAPAEHWSMPSTAPEKRNIPSTL